MDGDWECDDLPSLFRIFSRNLNWHRTFGKTLELATRAAARVGYWLARNTRSGSRRNIGAHYDLGNEFFELFLEKKPKDPVTSLFPFTNTNVSPIFSV